MDSTSPTEMRLQYSLDTLQFQLQRKSSLVAETLQRFLDARFVRNIPRRFAQSEALAPETPTPIRLDQRWNIQGFVDQLGVGAIGLFQGSLDQRKATCHRFLEITHRDFARAGQQALDLHGKIFNDVVWNTYVSDRKTIFAAVSFPNKASGLNSTMIMAIAQEDSGSYRWTTSKANGQLVDPLHETTSEPVAQGITFTQIHAHNAAIAAVVQTVGFDLLARRAISNDIAFG